MNSGQASFGSRIRMGVLTPSSNTALEPLTQALARSYQGSEVTAHFSRFRVTEISLEAKALGQFDDGHILAAAKLLADAKVDVIGWSGTAAGWMGFATDERLVQRIEQETGIRATTAVLALNRLIQRHGIERIGIVSPYTADVQQKIVDNYAALGVEVVAETHEGIRDNHAFGLVAPQLLQQRLESVARSHRKPQAIITYCTNLWAAQLAPWLDQTHDVMLLDTVSTTVWGMLEACGQDPGQLKGWGSMFDGTAA